MIGVHQRIGAIIVFLALLGAIWAAVELWRRAVSPAFRAYLRLLVALIGVQAVFGIVLVITGQRPQEGLHFVYGPAVLVTLPLALAWGAGREPRGEAGVLLGGCVLVMLLGVRAVATGG